VAFSRPEFCSKAWPTEYCEEIINTRIRHKDKISFFIRLTLSKAIDRVKSALLQIRYLTGLVESSFVDYALELMRIIERARDSSDADTNMTTPDPALLEILQLSHLFQSAAIDVLTLIAAQMKPVTYKKGDPIILENEMSDKVYFIKTGAVEITKYRPELQQVARVAMLKPGSHFSEFSVLNQSNKSASAFAFEDSEIYEMKGETFLKILVKFPDLAKNLVFTLAELNLNLAQNHSYVEYFDPSDIQINPEILNLVPQNLWQKYGILPMNYYTNNLLIAAKDPHKNDFFKYCQLQIPKIQLNIVLIGEQDFEATEKKIKQLYGKSAPSRIKKIKEEAPAENILEVLKRSHYFDLMNQQALEQIAQAAEKVSYATGEIIYAPKTPSEYFFILLSGRVDLSRPFEQGSSFSHRIGIGANESLSEVSLLMNESHAHMARATCPTTLLKFKKSLFLQFLKSGAFCLNISKLLATRLEFMTKHTGIKFNDGKDSPKMSEALKILTKEIMIEYQIFPLRFSENELSLGVVNPGSESIASVAVRYLKGYRINLEVITLENFKKWISQPDPLMSVNSSNIQANNQKLAKTQDTIIELNRFLADGYEARASDVHFEPSIDGFCVRYRIDGVMIEVANRIPKEIGNELISRVKVLSNMDIANHMIPQDGQLKLVAGDVQVVARVSTVPTKHGENAVLRLIRNRNSTVPLSMLVPDIYSIKLLKSVARAKQGLFLITGPTGSGKTTTLYSLISELNRVDVKIISLEDPVELEIPGTTQIEINDKSGLSFAKALRSTLRQDPDVVMVGEIRDEESAKIVFEAAMSGHLVISTLHTNSAFGVRNRLHELGVPSGILAAGLIGAMAQRLVRGLCKQCSSLRPITEREKELLSSRLVNTHIPNEIKKANGCMHCNETGYHGRIPIMEIWKKTRTIEELLNNDCKLEELIASAKQEGFIGLEDFGFKMVINGLTTIEEIERVTSGYT
jgi:type IV pilus assembly protein PilB